jgi:hypothetical protein
MKGEKIVSVLCKSIVQPVKREDWPDGWPMSPIPDRPNAAWVQAVYMHPDGHVWLLISQLWTGQMTEVPAGHWKIERHGWDK